MSCNDVERYKYEEIAVCENWGKGIIEGKEENVDLYFYSGGYEKNEVDSESHQIKLTSPDTWNGTYKKTLDAFRVANDIGYDVIIRSNTTNWLNIDFLKRFINSDDFDENCYYGGRVLCGAVSKYIPYMRGNILILSKKVVNDLLEAEKYELDGVDDVNLGLSLYKLYRERGESYISRLREVCGVNSKNRQEIIERGISAFYFRFVDHKNPETHIQSCVMISDFFKGREDLSYQVPTRPTIIETIFGNFKI